MDYLYFIKLQLKLECLRINHNGYLEAVPCDQPDQLPRVALYHTVEDDYHLFLSQGLPPLLRQQLKLLSVTTFFDDTDQIKRTLAEDHACEDISMGRTYQWHSDEDTVEADIVFQDGGSLCSIMQEGEMIAACSSVREDDTAAEAWVHTEPAYRGRGYGQRVVRAWAQRVSHIGKVAFYSHALDNLASQRLAQALPLRHLYDYVTYT